MWVSKGGGFIFIPYHFTKIIRDDIINYKLEVMEEQKATEVKCRTCEESQQVQNTQRFVLIGGGIFFVFGIYGIISFIKDIISLF